MSDSKSYIFIVVGPSGAGKSSFLERIIVDRPEIIDTVTNTTRSMRPGEQQGQPYDFISKQEFESRIKQDLYIEWAKVHDNYYGTPKSEIKRIQSIGKSIIMDVDIQGARSFKEYAPESISFFILPPSIDVLRQRVKSRDGASLSEEQLELRMKNAEIEILASKDFDHRIINDDFEVSYGRFKKIVDQYLNNV